MYKVTLKKGYGTEYSFCFNTWEAAGEFIMIALKGNRDGVEIVITREEEANDN
jgi:hypothetical protein